jgi:hypothetical protein
VTFINLCFSGGFRGFFGGIIARVIGYPRPRYISAFGHVIEAFTERLIPHGTENSPGGPKNRFWLGVLFKICTFDESRKAVWDIFCLLACL